MAQEPLPEREFEFPDKLGFLFEPNRYKIAHGGRGSGKSWGFARALLILGSRRPLRILCAREVQKSLKDSVHKLLSDQIEALGLTAFYTTQEAKIVGVNGTEIFFSGLASHTVDSIKSFEGADLCWIEEAQTVSKRSWDILIPTIRKPGSEIWVTLNPDMDTDDTYVRFVLNPPPRSHVVQINWSDNPWFPEELEYERVHCRDTDREAYENIWNGKCKRTAEGAIYAGEVDQAYLQNRIREIPYDPLHVVHCVWDLGWNDAMTIVMVQKIANTLIVIDYIEDSHRTYDWYVAELNKTGYRFGTDYLPHDGEHKNPQTGRSAREVLEALGRHVEITPNLQIEDGIMIARQTFPRVFFNAARTERLLQCLRRYRRAINQQTLEPGKPLHDEYSHGADAFRYACINAEVMGSGTSAPKRRSSGSWRVT